MAPNELFLATLSLSLSIFPSNITNLISVCIRACLMMLVDLSQYLTQLAQLSQRDRAAGWVSYGQKWKTGTGVKYLWTLQSYFQPFWRNWPAKHSNSWKRCKIRANYAVQGHSRSSRSIAMESPYATSYSWLIVIDNLSRTVSEFFKVFEPPFGA